MEINSLQTLHEINADRGILWEKIEGFLDYLNSNKNSILHHTKEMEEVFPLKHTIKDGLYTRELFMPKGMIVVSFIHKQNHPSFFMKGKMSIITDKEEVKDLEAPMVIQTEIGTQRIAYTHTDCVWVCVLKTDAKTVEEAEKELFTLNYKTLPRSVLTKKLELCQQ